MNYVYNSDMKNKKLFILYIIWIAFIWINSLMPADTSSLVSGGISFRIYELVGIDVDFELFHHMIRKWAHFTEYATLGLIGYFCVPREHRFKILVVSILVACFDECIQLFVDGRSGQMSDVFIDSLGITFSHILLYIGVN